MLSKYFVPAIHIFIWAILLSIPAIVFHNVKFETGLPDNFFWITNFYHIGLFYLNAYYLYPKFFTKKRWLIYIILIAGIIEGSYYGKLFFLRLLDPSFALSSVNDRIIFFPPIAFLIASFIFRTIVNRIRFEKLEKERKAERLATELKFLRSQVSPHFLFNVLTNLVSLARQKSELMEPSLIKLSDLLRYMLYETNEEKFSVTKEIHYLENYVELQQLRFGEDVDVELKIQNNEPGCTVEPMLLIPFVENAFKHGVGMVKKTFIKILIELKDQELFFKVSNNYSRENSSKDKSAGIGLANVKNRLNLLYPGKYRLSINDKDEIYTIELNLELTC